MSYVRRNSESKKSDVNGNSGKFRKSASVEPGPSSLSDYGGSSSSSRKSSNSGKKKSLSSFWQNLFRSNKIAEKDESQSSDDRQSNKSSSSYESVNTILSTNSFSFVNPKKYKGKPVKGKRIPVDDTTLPRNKQQGVSPMGNPSRRKISTFSRLGMKIGLKSKYNLQSCESLQHLHQIEDRNPGNSYVTTWNSNSSTFTRTNKRRAPLPPSSKASPIVKSAESDPIPISVSTPTPNPTPISTASTISTPISPPEPEPTSSSSIIQIQPKLQGLRRNSIGTDKETPSISGPGYSTKVVTSSNRYSVGQFLNNGNGKPFVITAGRHRRAASEGQNSNSANNSGTRGRIHVKGKKRAPPPPNPFGDPDAPEEPMSTEPVTVLPPVPPLANNNSNRNSINLPESFSLTTSVSVQPNSQPRIAYSSAQNQSQVKSSSKSIPVPKITPSTNRIESIGGNNPEVNGRRATAVAVPEVSAVGVSEANASQDANELEDEIAQNILNDRQEQERELQQQRQHSASVSSSSTPNSNTPLSASSANSGRHIVAISTHIHHPPVTERDVQVAKNELEALIKDNRSGSLETQAKKVDEQVKAQLLQLKREADKSPLLFFAQKQKQPTTTQLNSSSIPLSPPSSSVPVQSPQNGNSRSSALNANATPMPTSSSNPLTQSTSPSQSPPPPLPAKIAPRPWYKRSSSSSSSKNKNKNMKPITILPKFSELDREATRIVEENRRKSAEQAYNETARELISMFNDFNRDQIQSGNDTSSATYENDFHVGNLPKISLMSTPATQTSASCLGSNNRNSIVSTSSSTAVIPVTVYSSTVSATVPINASATSSHGLPSSSKDMKPLPFGNLSSSGSLEETKKLAIVQPQSKPNPNLHTVKQPALATPANSDTTNTTSVKLATSQYQSGVKTTTVSVAPVLSQSSVPKVSCTTTTVSTSSSNSTNNPRSIFSYQSSSLFSNNSVSYVPKTTISISSITTATVSSFTPGNEWSCPRCTLRNAHWRNLCDACYFRRDSPIQSTSAIFDRINAQIKASTPTAPALTKQKATFESPVATTNTTMATGTVSTAVEKPTQWVKPKTCDAPPCENLLSQLPNKENLAKEGKLEGMKLHEDPEVEELDITKVRQARLAFFARTKLDQEQQYQQVNESKPNNLALAGVGGDKISSQGIMSYTKERNVFSDGEDDTLDEILQLNANNCNNGPRTWKPLHLNRFRPMLESILESEGGHCNLDKIYENWHLNDNNEYSFGHWTNTFMPVREHYKVEHLNSNNLLSNSSSEEFDEQDSTMERDGKSKSRHRTSRSSHNQGFHLTSDNFLPVGASANKEKKLTLEDYRKLGAIPKHYRDQNDSFPTNSIERNDSNQHSRIFKSEENGNPPYGQSSTSNFSEHTFAVSKLLRNLESAIANGDHRLAATLAHDLALLRVNCVVNKSSEPFTIRVYVEDRFMQQGPFLVQVTTQMSVRELKLKIQSDWGIPNTFQKWILGRKIAEDDNEFLSNYELAHDSMAFLYLVTPELDKSAGNTSLVKKATDSSKKSKSVKESKEVSLADCSPKSLPRAKKKIAADMSIQTVSNSSEFSSKSLGRQNKGKAKPKAAVSASGCQTEIMPPLPQSPLVNKAKDDTAGKSEPVVPKDSGEPKPEVSSKIAVAADVQLTDTAPKSEPVAQKEIKDGNGNKDASTGKEHFSTSIDVKTSPVPVQKVQKEEKAPETAGLDNAVVETKSDNVDKPPTHPPRQKLGLHKDSKDKSVPSSPKIEPQKGDSIKSTGAATSIQNVVENLQPVNKSGSSAAAQSKKSDSNGISQSQSLTTQNSAQPVIKSDPPPRLPPKTALTSTEKKILASDNKILNALPSMSLKMPPTTTDEKKLVQEVSSLGKIDLYPKYAVTTTPKVISPSATQITESKSKAIVANGESNENQNAAFTPTPMPRLLKSEGSKLSSIGNIFAKITSSPVSPIMTTKSDVVETVKECKQATEEQQPKEEQQILLPPWRTSLIIEEDDNNVEDPTSQPLTVTSVVVDKEKPAKSELKDATVPIKSNSTEIITKEEKKDEKPIPVPRQRIESNIKMSTATSSFIPSINSNTTVITTITATTPLKLNPEVLKLTSKPTPLPVVTNSIALNITAQQNYLLKKPSTFIQAQKTESLIKEAPSEIGISVNKPVAADASNSPSLPPKEHVIVNGTSEAEPNWNPEPIPKRRNKLIRKMPEKTEEEITVEIKPLGIEANSDKSQMNDKTEKKEINVVPKGEPIYQNPKAISVSAASPISPVLSPNTSSIDGYCQTTLAFPAKSPKSPAPPQRPVSSPATNSPKSSTPIPAAVSVSPIPAAVPVSSIPATVTVSPSPTAVPVSPTPAAASVSPTPAAVSVSPTPKQTLPVQENLPEVNRKSLNSSIINMENGQLDDVKPSEIEKDVTFKKEVVQGASAIAIDDKKEGNVETYLKMLQLMEKVDLINTTEIADCPVCFNTVPVGEGIVLRDCLHIFCKECLIGAVQYADDSEVKCPFRDDSYSCNSALQEREIKALVPPEIFEKYLARSVKLAESKMVNTFHCKTNDCTGWCIFEDDVNLFKCPVCQRKNCLTCQAIHEGIDCQQYQRELAIAAETDENAKSSRLMLEQMIQRGEALECPACHVVLLKKWGCDWVRCTYCKTEICWVTRNFRWGPGGKGDTSGGCKCGVNGIRCHPKCTYCH